MNNVQTIFSRTVDPRAIAAEAKAKNAKNTVDEVGSRMASLDDVANVDKSLIKGDIDVSDAVLPPQGIKSKILGAIVPEKVSGFASLDDKGEMASLYTSSQDIGGTKELQYQRNEHGSQTYAVVTPQGQTTVRENNDGTLFMMESPTASSEDWAAMSSPDFKPPVLNPDQIPRTIDEAGGDYKSGVKHRSDLFSGLFSDDTRQESLKGLKDELLNGWNPFKKR